MTWLLTAALLAQDDPDEIRQKLKDVRVSGNGQKTLLSFALNLLSDSAGYDIVVAEDCAELGDEAAVLPQEDLSLEEMLRKLLDPHKLTLVCEEGKLVAVKRDRLARIIDVRYAPMASLMDEPPGGWPNADLAKALGQERGLSVNQLELRGVLKLLASALSVPMAAGDGVDASKKLTIDMAQASTRDALRPALEANGWTIVADGARALVVPGPAAPRGLDSLVRDLMRLNVEVKSRGKAVPLVDVSKKATLQDVIDAVSAASEMVIDVDEAVLKAKNAPAGGAAPKSAAAWEVLSSAAASRGLAPVYRNGLIQLVAIADAPAFVVTEIRKAVDLLPEK